METQNIDTPPIEFCNRCYYMRTYHGFNNGKPQCRYVCVNSRSQRFAHHNLDYWQLACPHAKPHDWRPPNIEQGSNSNRKS